MTTMFSWQSFLIKSVQHTIFSDIFYGSGAKNMWCMLHTKTLLYTEAEDWVEHGADSVSEVGKVTGQIVKEAALSMKAGKGDVSCGFTSDAIISAPDIFFDHLAAVFRSFLYHGNMTSSLLACSFLPLLKLRSGRPLTLHHLLRCFKH